MIRHLVLSLLCAGVMPAAFAAERAQVERAMKERLTAISQGASLEGLRIEAIDGDMAAFRAVEIASGKVVSREWDAPGSPEQRHEREVSESQVRGLVRDMLAKQYWTFQGTRFVPDANKFIFRFWAPGLEPVDYWCDAAEYEKSPERAAIREALLRFIMIECELWS
jgi:hypothetical protein